MTYVLFHSSFDTRHYWKLQAEYGKLKLQALKDRKMLKGMIIASYSDGLIQGHLDSVDTKNSIPSGAQALNKAKEYYNRVHSEQDQVGKGAKR